MTPKQFESYKIPKEFENYRTTQAKALTNLAQDIRQAASYEELVDALEYIISEAKNILEDAEARFDEERTDNEH